MPLAAKKHSACLARHAAEDAAVAERAAVEERQAAADEAKAKAVREAAEAREVSADPNPNPWPESARRENGNERLRREGGERRREKRKN